MICVLVSIHNHALNYSRSSFARINYSPLTDVVTGNEEGCFRLVGFEYVQKLLGVCVRPSVICNSSSIRHRAMIDPLSTVGLDAELWASNVSSATSGWKFVGVVPTAIFEETVRGVAISGCGSGV